MYENFALLGDFNLSTANSNLIKFLELKKRSGNYHITSFIKSTPEYHGGSPKETLNYQH